MPRAAAPAGAELGTSDLRRALHEVFDDSLRTSLTENPQEFADALAPVMLPALKQSIAAYLHQLVQTFEQILEQSLSPRSIRWRIEALVTGKRFAEVALLRSLVYRVDQVLLIDHESGLLLDRAVAPDSITHLDADQISGMITALNEFMKESFRIRNAPARGTLRYDRFTVWTERGRKATLAALIEGEPPAELRETLAWALTQIQNRLLTGSSPQPIEGRASEFLQPCLRSARRTSPPPSKLSRALAWALLILPLLLILAYASYWIYQRRQLSEYQRVLQAVPGVVIQRAERQGGRFRLSGLRDPYSKAPERALREAGLSPERAVLELRSFISSESEVLSERLRTTLQAPAGVKFQVVSESVRILGHAPFRWMRANEPRLLGLRAWMTIDTQGLVDDERIRMDQLRAEVESAVISFEPSSSSLSSLMVRKLSTVADRLREMTGLARQTGRLWTLEVLGSADGPGSDLGNRDLSRRRAEVVARALRSSGFGAISIRQSGLGATRSGRVAELRISIAEKGGGDARS